MNLDCSRYYLGFYLSQNQLGSPPLVELDLCPGQLGSRLASSKCCIHSPYVPPAINPEIPPPNGFLISTPRQRNPACISSDSSTRHPV